MVFRESATRLRVVQPEGGLRVALVVLGVKVA
jgi:hypothetical protein